jgi:hypothetical protein
MAARVAISLRFKRSNTRIVPPIRNLLARLAYVNLTEASEAAATMSRFCRLARRFI